MNTKLKERKEYVSSSSENSNSVSVEYLAEQAKYGSREALAALCYAIARRVLFGTMYFVQNQMDAEDVAQEVLIIVCKKIHTLRNPKAFSGWLNTIIEHTTRQYVIKNTKNSSIINLDEVYEADYIEEEGIDLIPEEYVIREDDRKMVMDIIRDLPERQRKAIFLFYYEGLGVNGIAKVMEISQSTVSHYLNMAREKIRKEIQRNSGKTGTLNAISMIGIGSLLERIMKSEASNTSFMDFNVIEKVLSKGATRLGILAGIKAILSISAGATKVAAITLCAAAALSGGILINGVVTKEISYFREKKPAEHTTGEIIYTGCDDIYTYSNPKQAVVQAENERGVLTAESWWITAKDSDEVIYNGLGNTVEEILLSMYDNKEEGIYVLRFLMEDPEGSSYTLAREFVIRNDIQ